MFSERFRASWSPLVLSILRIVVGLLFLEHGLSKYFGFPVVPPFRVAGILWVAGAIEIGAGALVAIGLFTRCAALVASGEMAAAYFMEHFPRSIFPIANGGDAAVLYCFIFLYLAFAGGGPWGVDAVQGRG